MDCHSGSKRGNLGSGETVKEAQGQGSAQGAVHVLCTHRTMSCCTALEWTVVAEWVLSEPSSNAALQVLMRAQLILKQLLGRT